MKIALLQVQSSETETVKDRRNRVSALVHSAAGADLIVLPELWAAGYFSFSEYADRCEPFVGTSVTEASRWAREMNSYIHLGSFIEEMGSNAYRNTAVLLDPSGNIIQRYSKIHVFGYNSREAELLTPGGYISVADSPFGKISSTTCYDLRFPGLWEALSQANSEIVIVPAAWPMSRLGHWRLFTSSRAVESQVIVVACNAVGFQGEIELGGHSRVIDPWGEIVVEAGTEEGATICDVDPQIVSRTRKEFPVLKDRLKSYGKLSLLGPEEIAL